MSNSIIPSIRKKEMEMKTMAEIKPIEVQIKFDANGLLLDKELEFIKERKLDQERLQKLFNPDAGCNCGGPDGHVPGGIHCRR